MAVDDKVVAMSFESSKFTQGVDKAIHAIDKLKASLKFPDAGKGVEAVSRALGHFQLGKVGQAVDQVSNKLRTFHLVAIGVLANISAQAVRAGGRFVKALTLDPVIQGYHEYETQLNAVQTILSNTRQAGVKLKDVTKALNELNHYADLTIYNFSEMTRNIGTFTAAGVDLKTAVASIKGIANLAAVSGSNAEQASTAMYQLSQAISAGQVKLQDWNSVVNAGLGGTLFQRALSETAVHMGTLNKGALKLTGTMKNVSINGQSFRQSLTSLGPKKKSWLTSGVLTTTLKQLSGDMTDAQLKALGYNDAQVKAIQTQAKMALQAATQVKTLSQLLDTTKEAVGSGWAQTWQIIFGNFGEAKTLFTSLSHSINGFVSASANARNKVLQDWKDLGGRTLFLNALKQGFHDLAAAVKPIKEAFRDIFPKTTGKDLYNLTVRFKALTQALVPSQQTIDNLHRTFRGLFAVLDIGKQIITGLFSVFAKLVGASGAGSGAFLNFTGNIGDFLFALDKALKKGGQIQKFFDGLASVLEKPVELLSQLAQYLSNLFSGFSPGGFSGQVNGMTQALTPLQKILQSVANAWDTFLNSFSKTGQILQPAVDAVVKLMQGLGPAINNAVSNMNFEAILQVIRTGLLGAIVIMIRNFFKGGTFAQALGGIGGGIFNNISASFGALTGSLQAMQTNIKAKTLKEIAIAVGILAASMVALSFVDPKKLNSSLAAITVAFAQLLGAMAIMDKVTSSTGFIKLPLVAASLILLAGAIDTLTIAVLVMSRLSWNELLKGLGGVGFLLIGITAAAGPLGRNSAGMIRAGVGITAMAIGLNILAIAVSRFARMSMAELGKGLGSVAAGLVIIAGAMKLMPPGTIAMGAGLIAVAFGLKILTGVVKAFGGMDWGTIGKGMAAIAGALVIIAGAMQLMPPNIALTAAGLVLVSFALKGIAEAVQSMGGMSIGQMAKGLGSLAIALAVLAAALILMSGSLAGAAALTVAAAGLALLAPALVALGKQSWVSIVKGLTALAVALTLIAVASIALSEAIPFMLGLGIALVAIGAGLALAGAGVFLIGAGLSAIAVSGSAAVGVLVQALIDLQKGIVQNAKLLALGLLEVVKAFADVAPKFVDAVVKILNSVADGIIKIMPKLVQVMNVLITGILQVIQNNQGKIIAAGFSLLLALLQGINDNIPKLTTAVVNIVITFLNAIAKQIHRIEQAGINVITSFVRGVISNMNLIIRSGVQLMASFLKGIANNIGRIAAAGLSIITSLVRAIANNYTKLFTTGASAIAHFITGIANAGAQLIAAGTAAAGKLIRAIVAGILKLVDVGARAIITFLNGVATAIDKYEPEMIAAGARIGEAIVTGMVKGLALAAPHLLSKAGDLVHSVKKKLEFWHSPPDEYGKYLGQQIISGFASGLSDTTEATDAAANMSKEIIGTVEDIFQITSPSKVMIQLGQYVGQGFAKGLRGSTDDINRAFTDLRNKLTETMQGARETIKSENAKIAQEREKGKKADKQAIAASKQLIKENQAILDRTAAARKVLISGLTKDRKHLVDLVKDYTNTANKLDAARQILDDAIKTRADAKKSLAEQYGALPEIVQQDDQGNQIDPADQLANYTLALKNQIAAEQSYSATLDQLRKLGLDDKTYQKLLDEGPVDQQFADALLAGGKTAVDSLNTLDSQLDTAAGKLADHGASELYDAGVKAAQGIVDGLASKEKDLEKQMNVLAKAMVRAIKKALKIKSPSQIFAEVGQLSMEGMAQGISESTAVTDALDVATQSALDQMRKNMQGVSDVINEELNPNPVITPILDLTQIQAQAGRLAALTNVTPINAAASFGQASAISAGTATTEAERIAALAGTSVNFEQNNYSPEALSSIEIYRQTKNQLSQVKSALNIN
jgi:tape measure domain-containing protein